MNLCCHHCGGFDKPLYRCSDCRHAVYCSEQCQENSWSTHKLVCPELDVSDKPEKDLERALEDYTELMEVYDKKLNFQNRFEKLQNLNKKSFKNKKAFRKHISSMFSNMFENEVKTTEKMNLETMHILEVVLKHVKATKDQIQYVMSEIVKYGQAVQRLHLAYEESSEHSIESGLFREIVSHYKNAWSIVDSLLPDQVDSLDAETRVIGNLVSEIVLKTAECMLKYEVEVDPEQISGLMLKASDWATGVVQEGRRGMAGIVREFANCFSNLVGQPDIKPFEVRKTNEEAREDAKALKRGLSQMHSLLAIPARLGHWIADSIDEKTTTEFDGKKKALGLRLVWGVILSLGFGYRYTVGWTSRADATNAVQAMVDIGTEKGVEAVQNQRNTIRDLQYMNMQKQKELEQLYNTTKESRAEFIQKISANSHESLAGFLSSRLAAHGRRVPPALRMAQPKGFIEAENVVASIEGNVAPMLTIGPPSKQSLRGSTDAIAVSDADIIESDFTGIAESILATARQYVKSHPAWQYPAVAESKAERIAIIERQTEQFLNEDLRSTMSASTYAGIVQNLGLQYGTELQAMTEQTRQQNIMDLQKEFKSIDATLIGVSNDLKEVSRNYDELRRESTAISTAIKVRGAQQKQKLQEIDTHADNVVEQMFQDIRLLPLAGNATAGFLENLIGANLSVLFKNLSAAGKILKDQSLLLGIQDPSWWMALSKIASTSMKITLGVSLVTRIVTSVAPVFIRLFDKAPKSLQEWLKSCFPNDEADEWESHFMGGWDAKAANGIYFSLGVIRALLIGSAQAIEVWGSVIIGLLPALLAILSLVASLMTTVIAFYYVVVTWSATWGLLYGPLNLIFGTTILIGKAPTIFGTFFRKHKCVQSLVAAGVVSHDYVLSAAKQVGLQAWLQENLFEQILKHVD